MLLGSATRIKGEKSIPFLLYGYYYNSDLTERWRPEVPSGYSFSPIGYNYSNRHYFFLSGSSGSTNLLKSKDGKEFEVVFNNFPFGTESLTSGDNVLILQSSELTGRNIWRSLDGGFSFTNMGPLDGGIIYSTEGNGVIVSAIGTAGTSQHGFYYSTDNAETFSHASAGFTAPTFIRRLLFNGSEFVAIGYHQDLSNRRLVTSPDGSTWTLQNLPSGITTLRDLVVEDGVYLLTADDKVWRSDDLDTWEEISNPFGTGETVNLVLGLRSGIYFFQSGTGGDPAKIAVTMDKGDNWDVKDATYSENFLLSDFTPFATRLNLEGGY